MTYEFAVVVEAGGLQVEYRALAGEAVGDDDAVALAGTPTWVVTRSADPDRQPVSEHAERREALAAYRALLVAQAVG